MKLLTLFLTIFIATVQCEKVSYNGYQLFDVIPKNNDQDKVLLDLQISQHELDFWNDVRPGTKTPVKILVKPNLIGELQKVLATNNIEFEITEKNVGAVMEKHDEINFMNRQLSKIRKKSSPDFTFFWTYNEINEYMTKLSNDYSNLVTVIKIGTSTEGRDINAIEISKTGKVKGDRPIIFVDATIHAREWIAPMVALALIHQLVENSELNLDVLNNVDWVIIPVINVDGYVFSHEHARFWRKTRSKNDYSNCVGTDPNRNFDFQWNNNWGSSSNPCSETYRGNKPNSEPEVEAVTKYLSKYKSVKVYLTLHSYGQYLLYAYGYERLDVENYKDHDYIGKRVQETVSSYNGTVYTVGSTSKVLYVASGNSVDYAAGVLKIPIAYTMELPGNGFDIPPHRIEPVISETIPGIKEFGLYADERWALNGNNEV